MNLSERRNKWREKQFALGNCVYCGQKAEENRRSCVSCSEKSSSYSRRKRIARSDNGLCVCGREAYLEANRVHCLKCLNKSYMRNYGISFEDYLQMVQDQQNLCLICKQSETGLSKRGHVRGLAIDHHHITGKIRGLLCTFCNASVVGVLEKYPDRVVKAIAYIQKYEGSNG